MKTTAQVKNKEITVISLGITYRVKYARESKTNNAAVKEAVEKINLPQNGTVKIIRNGVEEVYEYDNCGDFLYNIKNKKVYIGPGIIVGRLI